MQRRVMHASANAGIAQHLHHRRATALQTRGRQQHLKHMPVGDRTQRVDLWRQLDAQGLETGRGRCRKIGLRQFGASPGHRIEMFQLAQTDRGIDVGQVEFTTGNLDVHAVQAAAHHALQAQPLDRFSLGGVVQHQAAAFGAGDVLVGLKAETDQIAETADALRVPMRVDRLRRILDDAQTMRLRDAIEPVHIDRQTGQVDRHDGLGARRDRGLDRCQVNIASLRINVDEHRLGTDGHDHIGCGDPGDGGGDDFVARADTGQAQSHLHRRRAIGEGAHRPAAEQRRQLRLEFGHFRSRSDPAGSQHKADIGNRLGVDVGLGEGQKGGQTHGSRQSVKFSCATLAGRRPGSAAYPPSASDPAFHRTATRRRPR